MAQLYGIGYSLCSDKVIASTYVSTKSVAAEAAAICLQGCQRKSERRKAASCEIGAVDPKYNNSLQNFSIYISVSQATPAPLSFVIRQNLLKINKNI
jgi:hypothetical protein